MAPSQSGSPNTLENQPNRSIRVSRVAVLALLVVSLAEARGQDTAAPTSRRVSGVAPAGQNGAYFRLQHFAGDGIGYQDSYSTFGLFQPIGQGDSRWFADSQLLLTNSAAVGANIGLGYRRYQPGTNRILGAGLWCDLDNRNERMYQQVAVGLESLGDLWDFRSNVYVPVGNRGNSFGYQSTSVPVYQGNQLLLSQAAWVDESAMTGLDLEAGRRLPGWLGDRSLWLFGGLYHFENSGVPEVEGWKCRLEGYLTSDVSAQLSVSSDSVFDTSVVFGVTWTFGGSARRRGMPVRVRDRLVHSSRRNQHMVVGSQVGRSEVAATAPSSSDPLSILHIDSNAGTGGDGSIETPYRTLTEALAGATGDSILFAHADSVFTGESITLLADQPLFGEGIEHLVETQFGSVALPRATSGTALPILQNAPGTAITLVDDSALSGFSIVNPAGVGILASGLSDAVATVDNVTVSGSGAEGIKVENCSNTEISFDDIEVTGAGTHGIAIEGVADSTIDFGTTRIISPGRNGIHLDNLPRTTVNFGDVLVNDPGWGRSLLMQNCNDATTLNVTSLTAESGYAEVRLESPTNSTITFGDVRLLGASPVNVRFADNSNITFGDILAGAAYFEASNSTVTVGDIQGTQGAVTVGGSDSTFELGNLSFTNNVEGLWVAFADRSTVRVRSLTADTIEWSALAVGYSTDLTFEIGDVAMNDTNQSGVYNYHASLILTGLTRGSVTLGDTTLIRPGNIGIDFLNNTDTDIHFTSLAIDDATDTGLQLWLSDTASSMTFDSATIRRPASTGVLIHSWSNNAIALENLTIEDSGGAGILANTYASLTLAVRNTSITNGAGYAVDLNTWSSAVLNATIEGCQMSGNNGASPDLRILPQVSHWSETPTIRLNLGDALDPTKANDIDAYQLGRNSQATFELGGTLGQGSAFADDNGNVANNGNTSAGGAPNVVIEGTTGQFDIVDPATIPIP